MTILKSLLVYNTERSCDSHKRQELKAGFLDELKQILGRGPSTEPLFCGVSTDDFDDVNESDETLPDAVPRL